MHQPVYQELQNDYFLMPWARLHAVKDYYSMVDLLNKYEKLKLNFSLVPILLNALESYADKGILDLHSKLTITPVKDLTDEDKIFIINNFFSANYTNLILPYKRYAELYRKRYSSDNVSVRDFTDEEYSDIMAWFNLVWFAPAMKRNNPVVRGLITKGQNYTDEERVQIIELQRNVIREIIPAYKKQFKNNRIEILATPYYHPIMPILLDKKYTGMDLREDAVAQVKEALEKYEEIFGEKPKGVWPPEQCISAKTLDFFADMGFEWTLADESILSKTLNKEFVRDFKGYLEDPYDLTSTYKYVTSNKKKISIIFRDAVIPSLISFEYPQYNSVDAANDLYDRIKTIQEKLQQSPDKTNLLTIALDGENCWEKYPDDGEYFIKTLYELISKDETLETVLISEYLDGNKNKKELSTINTGSWINRNLKLWIDEPTKDLAWKYVIKAKKDLSAFLKKCKDKDIKDSAERELQISEGSDWFWWYGEPNDSGQDEVFDYLFRIHLINMYNIIGKPVPEYLNVPLIAYIGKPLRTPKSNITPCIDGLTGVTGDWENAGCIEIPDGPILQSNKPFDKIYFGCDKNYLYLRFDLNSAYTDFSYKNLKDYVKHFQVCVYIKNEKFIHSCGAHIRQVSKSDYIYPTMIEKYSHEVVVMFMNNKSTPTMVSKANKDGVWTLKINHNVKCAVKNILEVAIPFDDIDVESGEQFDFCIVNAFLGVVNDFYPKDVLLTVRRP